MPKLVTGGTDKPLNEIEALEEDFYRSLGRLADHYGITELSNTRLFGYPCNIAYSIWETENFLQKNHKNWDSLRLIQDTDKTYLVSEESFNTGATLYYIPVVPLFLMLKDKQKKKSAQLLLSVCSYLYHIADVPYYRQEASYLHWEYEMLANWVNEDEETDSTEIYKRELAQAEWIGERMEQKLFNRKNLPHLRKRLESFKIGDDFENECCQLAQNALDLYEMYPDTPYYRYAKIQDGEIYEQGEDEEEIITMGKYVSFYADSTGWLAQSLFECVNNEFNECTTTQEPALTKRFDGSPLANNDFDFEKRLFNLMDDLSYLLNTYKREYNEPSY